MCGIAGFIGTGTRGDLEHMISSIRHRGPDRAGLFIHKQVGFGHARLSIIDLSPTGNQPMTNADETITLVFNGEIYNFLEIKKTLMAQGIVFKGTSDTEVILKLYELKGEECFKDLNGMFAIAIYDFKKERLLLARDRMGKKPLYWTYTQGTFLFGSELKALLAHPLFTKEIDIESVNKYLLYEFVPTPKTIFKNVFKLDAGHYLTFEKEKIKQESFWKPDFHESNLPFKEALSFLEEKIKKSIAMRLLSDVPLGIFLSGGLDSSAVAYFASQSSSSRIKTFSIGFEDQSFDESLYARKVAKFLGTEHHESIIGTSEILNTIPHVFNLLDEPIADASILPTFLLSNFARKHVTVALGGDGGDELFAGYYTFQAELLAQLYMYFPQKLRSSIIEPLIQKLPVSHRNFSFDFKLKKFTEGFVESSGIYRHQVWLGSFNKRERKALFKDDLWGVLDTVHEYDDVDFHRSFAQNASIQNQLLYIYQRLYMMENVLVKVDRASMFTSLEVRAPLLDYNLVEFANSLPFSFKLRGFTTKYIFKKLMENKLPKDIVYRSKKGFGIPLGQWLRNDLRSLCENVLSKDTIEKGGMFNYRYVETLKKQHMEGSHDHRKKLWTLMVFEMWRKNFG